MITELLFYSLILNVHIVLTSSRSSLLSMDYDETNSMSEYRYFVIIDLSVSESQVIVYKFKVPYIIEIDKLTIDLIDEHFTKVDSGITSYAGFPHEEEQMMLKLMKIADIYVPIAQRDLTSIFAVANAGLKLMPSDRVKSLVDSIPKTLMKSNYYVEKDAFQILECKDEGLHSWITVNLLLELAETGKETVAVVNLGTSCLMTAWEVTESESRFYPSTDINRLNLFQTDHIVYGLSYAKLGLFIARHRILKIEANNEETTQFKSVCLDPSTVDEPWLYLDVLYSVSGAPRANLTPEEVYNRCYSTVFDYVKWSFDWEPQVPPKDRVVGIGAIWYIALDAGIVDKKADLGITTISECRKKAIKACATKDSQFPWLCMELVYVVALLQGGYKIPDHDHIYLYRKISGHVTSWTLGFAYYKLSRRLYIPNDR